MVNRHTLVDRRDTATSSSTEVAAVHADLSAALTAVRACGGMAEAAHVDDAVGTLDLLTRLEGEVAAATAAVLARLTRAGHFRGQGATSPTAWLADRYHLAGREASRRARRGKVLGSMPATLAALREGDITVDHADAIANAYVAGTFGKAGETEDALLPAAVEAPADEFRRDVRRRQTRLDAEKANRDAARQFKRRSARFTHRDDGMIAFQALLHPTAGVLFEQTVQAMTRPDPADTPESQRRTPDQRRADGLIALIEAAAGGGAPPESGGVRPHIGVLVPYELLVTRAGRDPLADIAAAQAAPRTGGAAARAVGSVAVQDTVSRTRRSAAAARSGAPHAAPAAPSGSDTGPPPAELQGYGALSPVELERLLCDADITRIVTRGRSEVLDVGRATRQWPAATRKAVIARDRHCRWPGCSRPPAWCHVHHVDFWEHGGPTNQHNGVLLCSYHHHMVHDARWTLRLDPATARVTVISPDRGIERTSHPPGFDPPSPTGPNPSLVDGPDPARPAQPDLCLLGVSGASDTAAAHWPGPDDLTRTAREIPGPYRADLPAGPLRARARPQQCRRLPERAAGRAPPRQRKHRAP